MAQALLRRARAEALRRGVLGGSRAWLVIGGLAWVVSALRWALRHQEEVIFVETLEPGEQLLITTRRPEGRRRHRSR
ncbi:MAG: hypothetical protein WHS89_07955 [Acidimicrobiales bacterium]|jgi:hypothetical protein